MREPRFRADYRPVRVSNVDGDRLLVIGETRQLLISDPVAADLADLLDGSRTVAEVLELAGRRHPPVAAARALRRLTALRLLTEQPVTVGAARAAGWDARGVHPDRAEQWSCTGTVALVDAGSPGLAAVAATLAAQGLTVRTEHIDAPDLERWLTSVGDAPVVAVPDWMADPRLARLDRARRDAGRDWLSIRPHGEVLLLGPHLVPGETGCWHCLSRRWLDNEQVPNFVADRYPDRPRVNPARAALPALATALAGLLLAELPVLVQHGYSARVTGRMLALDTRDLTVTGHDLVRAPHCPACGDPELISKGPVRIDLAPTPLQSTVDGTPRGATVAETYRRISPEVSRYLGVVTRLAALDRPVDGLMYGFRAGHHFPPTQRLDTLRENLRGHSGGQGRTEIEAKVSAIAEAIERYCGVWRDDRPEHRSSYADLGARRAVHLREVLLFSADQYAGRAWRNPTLSHFHHTPRPLPDDRPVSWTTGWSLTRDEPRDIPSAYCWYGHPEAALEVCAADSNGNAAGNTPAEAVLHGFCELVERDSVALWWYHRSLVPGVDLDSFADPWIDAVRRHYATVLGRDLWVLDITADLGVPAFAAVSGLDGAGVLVGFGAHPDARVAVSRAISEVNQFLPLVARSGTGIRCGITGIDARRWFDTVRLAGQPWLAPAPGRPPSTVDTHRGGSTGDAAGDVRRCVAIAERAGLETIVVDQSRPDLPLAVAKVIVPGLRHFWRRLGAGRLWDVPAALGRTPRARDEESINQWNVFF